MQKSYEHLLLTLEAVQTSRDFKRWVRTELRQVLPHSSLLATVGTLHGVGSVPTHRLEVDFPLNLVEDLKTHSGALDDPLMFGWFKSERLRYVDVEGLDDRGGHRLWRQVLLGYGMRQMIVHGVLDHSLRRFVFFQIANPLDGDSQESARLVANLINAMANVVITTINSRMMAKSRHTFSHPTLTLTPTELHIIELLAQGLSNKEIARLRGVSDSTVKTQVQRTGAKLGATRRAEIVALAMPLLCLLPAQALMDYGRSPKISYD